MQRSRCSLMVPAMEGRLQPTYKVWVLVSVTVLLGLLFLAYRIDLSRNTFAGSSQPTTDSSPSPTISPTLPYVSRVVDGDTVVLSTGERVRYIGINAPESVDPRRPVECFAREATAENKRLVEGHAVTLVKDVSETDSFGRLLRYVYVDGVMINEELVRTGYARASAYPPDVKFQAQLTLAEQEARQLQAGLWGANCR